MHSLAVRRHQLHECLPKRTSPPDYHSDSSCDRADIRPCQEGLWKFTRPSLILASSERDLENIRPPRHPVSLETGGRAVSGQGEISSGKYNPSSGLAGPDLTITNSFSMFEEQCDDNSFHLSRFENGADADEITSLCGRQRDSKADGGSTLSRSSSECSLVTSTHGTATNKGRCGECSPSFRKGGEGWTDDKHSSYLSSMEDDFVRNMYERVFCAVDVCGQAPENGDSSEIDSAQSRLQWLHDGDTCGVGEFRVWRNGRWRPVMLRKQFVGGNTPVAVFSNPWIRRFRPNNIDLSNDGINASLSLKGFIRSSSAERTILKRFRHTVKKQDPEPASDAEKGAQLWQKRLQKQCFQVDKLSSGITLHAPDARKRDDRTDPEGACKRLKLQSKRDDQGCGIALDSLDQKVTADVCKSLKTRHQQVRHVYTSALDQGGVLGDGH